MSTLHVHLDESGNWTFGPKGSRYFVLTAAWTYNPRPLAHDLTALRFGLIRTGASIESFHASPDKQATRDEVVRIMLAHDDWKFASVVLEKRKINPVLRDPQKFYPKFAGTLLKFILRGREQKGVSHALVYADTIPMDTNAKREGVLKAIKSTCAADLPAGCGHHTFSHRRESNKWLQVADYCCWAVFKKWEGNDPRTYNQLQARLASPELEITAPGQTTYY